MPRSRRWRFETGNGSDGWLRTGASTLSSTIIARANPPVMHMPTADAGTATRASPCRPSARSHSVTGEVLPVAKAANSRETQHQARTCVALRTDAGLTRDPEQVR